MRQILAALTLSVGVALPAAAADFPACTSSILAKPISSETERFPTVGSIVTVEIGQSPLIYNITTSIYAGPLIIAKDFHAKYTEGVPAGLSLDIKAGEYFVSGQAEDGSPVYSLAIDNSSDRRREARVTKNRHGKRYQAIISAAPTRDKPGFLTVNWSIGPLKYSVEHQIEYSVGNCVNQSSGPFRQELVYSGLNGQNLKLFYREFEASMAGQPHFIIRPAFNQDLSYDLSQGRIIGYKGARFEVLEATNVSLTIKVLKTMD